MTCDARRTVELSAIPPSQTHRPLPPSPVPPANSPPRPSAPNPHCARRPAGHAGNPGRQSGLSAVSLSGSPTMIRFEVYAANGGQPERSPCWSASGAAPRCTARSRSTRGAPSDRLRGGSSAGCRSAPRGDAYTTDARPRLLEATTTRSRTTEESDQNAVDGRRGGWIVADQSRHVIARTERPGSGLPGHGDEEHPPGLKHERGGGA